MSQEIASATRSRQPTADSLTAARGTCARKDRGAPRAERFVVALKTRALLAAAVLALAPFAANAQNGGLVDSNRFELVSSNGSFSLRARALMMPVPTEWLIPPSTDNDAFSDPSGVQYDKQVDSFAIAPGKTGLHVSSFEISEGSLQLAAGRDVFLVLDEATHKLRPGLIGLGVTKSRVRAMGCFEAAAAKFFLADLNHDRALDIGVMREKLDCREVPAKDVDDIDRVEGPYYNVEPIRWYVFHDDAWSYDATLDGRFPTRTPYWELPLISIIKTPVEFVMGLSRQPR